MTKKVINIEQLDVTELEKKQAPFAMWYNYPYEYIYGDVYSLSGNLGWNYSADPWNTTYNWLYGNVYNLF